MYIFIFYSLTNYGISYPVQYNYEQFRIHKEYFKKNNYNLITSNEMIINKELIKENIDFNKINNLLIKENIRINYQIYLFSKIIDNILKNKKYNNSIFLGFHPFIFNLFLEDKYNLIKKNNIKIFCWMDDLQYFTKFLKIKKFNYLTYDKDYNSEKLNKIDLILTPSINYFKNINSRYLSKTRFIFYSLDERLYDKITNINYNNRINKIILSGCILKKNQYKSRYSFLKLINTNFNNIGYYLKHPGYDSSTNYNLKYINYYNELVKYKGAFVGLYNYPLNFLLAKIIEVLFCGCLGFFDKSSLLKTELGLLEFVHYIPITNNKNELIKDINYYKKYLNTELGNKIALNGYNYIREQFKSINNIKNYKYIFDNFLNNKI